MACEWFHSDVNKTIPNISKIVKENAAKKKRKHYAQFDEFIISKKTSIEILLRDTRIKE